MVTRQTIYSTPTTVHCRPEILINLYSFILEKLVEKKEAKGEKAKGMV